MRKEIVYLFSIAVLLNTHVFGQDFLVVPSSNPLAYGFGKEKKSNLKLLNQEDSLIYNYDTLSLPFIDDFTTNHLPKRIYNLSDSTIQDTVLYRLFIGNELYRGIDGFRSDSTYEIYLDTAGNELQRIANGFTTVNVRDITIYPSVLESRNVFPPFNFIFDALGNPIDTNILEPDIFQDSARFYLIPSDSNDFYIDRSVYLNNTFGIDPPSIGVVTFDGLNEFGRAYDIQNSFRLQADRLTSVPIDLTNLPDTNIYFSFFYQPQGLSFDKLSPEDSLTLDFYNPSTKRWINVWGSPGYAATTFDQAILKVPNRFHQNAFQFRFRAYANSSGAFDQWHVDYIYLDHNRNKGDTIYNDVAYQFDAPSLLKDYTAMPWFHFKTDPALYMSDTAITSVVNSSSIDQEVRNKIVILDNTSTTDYYQFPSNANNVVNLPSNIRFKFRYPIDFAFPAADVKSEVVFKSRYDVRINQQGGNTDFIRENDTVVGKTILRDYYAYDDGTAETGYGVNPQRGSDGYVAYMAVEFNIPQQDTVGAFQLYFVPRGVDVSQQSFQLVIWNSLNPPNILFTTPFSFNPEESKFNGYLTYNFDSLVIVNQTFYAGIRQVGQNSLSIGYDLNNNHRDKIFWSQNGFNWSNPSLGILDGSLMLRPIFRRTAKGVGIKENRTEISLFKLYPNPANQLLNIEMENNGILNQWSIYDQTGRVVATGNELQIDVAQLTKGIYFLQLIETNGRIGSRKFMVAH